MTESQLEALLYTGRASDSYKRMPDFPLCHQERKRKGMTKILLWQEYQQDADENAYGYSQFFNLYNNWLKLQKRSMRQHHIAGEKLFLDVCGPTIPVINPDIRKTGKCSMKRKYQTMRTHTGRCLMQS
ncbi:hypothetical protein [Enterobacter mori]|uniref:hypothetical protein n=1 Tax=Enterobacter mori TaxID=539813 RepID=UPI00201620D9|nr:hypothetical protein [Enterobacter mori]